MPSSVAPWKKCHGQPLGHGPLVENDWGRIFCCFTVVIYGAESHQNTLALMCHLHYISLHCYRNSASETKPYFSCGCAPAKST